MLMMPFLLVILCIFMTQLLRRGYDPHGWGISLSAVGVGATIIDRPWFRAWIPLWDDPEPGPSLMLLPWGDIGMVFLALGFLCLVLWVVQTACHKEEPPMEDK